MSRVHRPVWVGPYHAELFSLCLDARAQEDVTGHWRPRELVRVYFVWNKNGKTESYGVITPYSGCLNTGHVLLGVPEPLPTCRCWNYTLLKPVRVPYPFRMSGGMVRIAGSVMVSDERTDEKGSALLAKEITCFEFMKSEKLTALAVDIERFWKLGPCTCNPRKRRSVSLLTSGCKQLVLSQVVRKVFAFCGIRSFTIPCTQVPVIWSSSELVETRSHPYAVLP